MRKTVRVGIFTVSLFSSSYFGLNLMRYRQTSREMGVVQWEKLARRDLSPNPTSLYLILHLGALCAKAGSPFDIKDGQQSTVLGYSQCSLEDSTFSVEIVTAPVRVIIASSFPSHRVGRLSGLCNVSSLPSLVPCGGALFKSVRTPRRRSAVARFTAQRYKEDWEFCEWKHLLHSKTELLCPEALLGVKYNTMHIRRYKACSIIPLTSP